jgi:hypothetical protein
LFCSGSQVNVAFTVENAPTGLNSVWHFLLKMRVKNNERLFRQTFCLQWYSNQGIHEAFLFCSGSQVNVAFTVENASTGLNSVRHFLFKDAIEK